MRKGNQQPVPGRQRPCIPDHILLPLIHTSGIRRRPILVCDSTLARTYPRRHQVRAALNNGYILDGDL